MSLGGPSFRADGVKDNWPYGLVSREDPRYNQSWKNTENKALQNKDKDIQEYFDNINKNAENFENKVFRNMNKKRK